MVGVVDSRRREFVKWLVSASASGSMLIAAPGLANRRVAVHHVRISVDQEKTRVVFDLSAPVEYTVFSLSGPARVVVDLEQCTLDTVLTAENLSTTLIRDIRYAPRAQTGLRIVFDLASETRPRSFLLRPSGSRGHRLVLDLHADRSQSEPVPPVVGQDERMAREVVVAIDPGHGGRDPGAIGAAGTFEKDVVLAISQRLAKLMGKESGIRPILTREKDIYLPLRERTQSAREAQADLFLSIHADASHSARVRGSSVYVLSERGASSEMARWLASRENAAGLANGIKVDDKDDIVAKVLLDLSQTDTIRRSQTLGESLLREIQRVNTVHSDDVERAGFVVLKSLDMPSALVETAFISNPAEEKRLRTAVFQATIAKAIYHGVMQYFLFNAPADTLIAQRNRGQAAEYVIQRGDTLSEIAIRYGISLQQLREMNDLDTDVIHVGQTLRIPLRGST